MNHDRFPLPGQPEHLEPAQYHLDPTDPEQADLADSQAAEARRVVAQQDYLLAPPQRPEQATQPINEGRFGFRALRGAVRRMRQR